MRFGCLPQLSSLLLHAVLVCVHLGHGLKTTQRYCLPLAGQQAEWSHEMSHNREVWFEQWTKKSHCQALKLRKMEPESFLECWQNEG